MAAAETVIHLGPPRSEMLKKQHESTPGLFGAYGETYMVTSTALTSAASGPSTAFHITVMVQSDASGTSLTLFLFPACGAS